VLAASYGCAASQTSCLDGVATHSGYELLLHQGMGPSPVSSVLYSPCTPTNTSSNAVRYPAEPESAGPWYLPADAALRPRQLLGVKPHTVKSTLVLAFVPCQKQSLSPHAAGLYCIYKHLDPGQPSIILGFSLN